MSLVVHKIRKTRGVPNDYGKNTNNLVVGAIGSRRRLEYHLEHSCHGLGYFGILLAISWPRICWDTFGNIMA